VHGVAADLARRDAHDSGRKASPTAAADDAVHLDSSALAVDEVVAAVLDLAAAAGLQRRP
jgi:CMP/dCMP kinase